MVLSLYAPRSNCRAIGFFVLISFITTNLSKYLNEVLKPQTLLSFDSGGDCKLNIPVTYFLISECLFIVWYSIPLLHQT